MDASLSYRGRPGREGGGLGLDQNRDSYKLGKNLNYHTNTIMVKLVVLQVSCLGDFVLSYSLRVDLKQLFHTVIETPST